MNSIISVPIPKNEPVHEYLPNSQERIRLNAALKEISNSPIELPHVIGGKHRMGSGTLINIVQPHNHNSYIGTMTNADQYDTNLAIKAALTAKLSWSQMPFEERASIFLRAADLLSGPWREKMVAATMLGQSKSVYQAEIDSSCELVDFWRFNVSFARKILSEQPISSPGVWNQTDYRSLEGFIYAITPFNFTAIAGNLPTAPALMGNTIVWKPATNQTFSAYLTIKLLEAAGLPPGVINLLTGNGIEVSNIVLTNPYLSGIHFTGSAATFNKLWQKVGTNIQNYYTYPRLVGETGGKDFIIAHSSANLDTLRTALIHGAFDYQGQKCSAASRAFIPQSIWNQFKDELVSDIENINYGDITDLANYGGALIDKHSFMKNINAIERAKSTSDITLLAGGNFDGSKGYFVQPTLLISDSISNEMFSTEYFGPILAVHIYPDNEYKSILNVINCGTRYALTGSIIANDRTAIQIASSQLRNAAGNFYINDKPTGAIVGQQPFGGSRASGTNDKAGSALNLTRWVSARSIKESFSPQTNYVYAHMQI